MSEIKNNDIGFIEKSLEELGLINFDDTLATFISENISYPFDDNGNKIRTNVSMTKPERWSDQKMKSTIKNVIDGNHANLPLISLHRSGGDITMNIIPHWISHEHLNTYNRRQKGVFYSEKYDESDLINKLPTSIILTYDVNIITKNKKHNDHLLEQFIQHKNQYWKLGVYPFEAQYSSFIDNSDSADQNQERIISSAITIDLKGYVRAKTYKKADSTNIPKKILNKVVFDEIEVTDISQLKNENLFN